MSFSEIDCFEPTWVVVSRATLLLSGAVALLIYLVAYVRRANGHGVSLGFLHNAVLVLAILESASLAVLLHHWLWELLPAAWAYGASHPESIIPSRATSSFLREVAIFVVPPVGVVILLWRRRYGLLLEASTQR